MNTNILTLASSLSDHDLLARVVVLAAKEREASAELVAHLAALDARPALYAAEGHGSLFTYCTDVLRLSEDAACNRIQAARACRDFPMILDLLGSGAMSLTSVRMLRPHLTTENHEAVLARASGRSRREIEALVAELAPRPDVPSSVRKLPTAMPAPTLIPAATPPAARVEAATLGASEPAPPVSSPPPPLTTRRPVIESTSPERYRVQFTIGKESHDKLRRVQALLRREIPDGDPGAIFDRALTLLLEKVEKATVSQRDGGQCAFVSKSGHRCTERTFLEFHHIVPYALGGLATVENISLRCRRHNQYEADLIFGPRSFSEAREVDRLQERPAVEQPSRQLRDELQATERRGRSAHQARDARGWSTPISRDLGASRSFDIPRTLHR